MRRVFLSLEEEMSVGYEIVAYDRLQGAAGARAQGSLGSRETVISTAIKIQNAMERWACGKESVV